MSDNESHQLAETLRERRRAAALQFEARQREDSQEATRDRLEEIFGLQSREFSFAHEASIDGGLWTGEIIIAGRTYTVTADGGELYLSTPQHSHFNTPAKLLEVLDGPGWS